MAWRNLGRNLRRSLATGSAIVVGYAGLCLLGGYIISVEQYLRFNMVYTQHYGHLVLYSKGGVTDFYSRPKKYQIPGELIQKVQTIAQENPDIQFVVPTLTGMGLLSRGERSVPILTTGMEPDKAKSIRNHPEFVAWKNSLALKPEPVHFGDESSEDKVSVTTGLARLVGRAPPFEGLSEDERTVQIAGRSFYGDLNAVNGVLGYIHTTGIQFLEDTDLIAPLRLTQDLFATDGANYVGVFLKSSSAIKRTKAWLEEKLKGENIEVLHFSDERIGITYVGNIGFLYIMAGFFVFLIFSAVVMSIMNSMTLGILERQAEIGTMKSLGFLNGQIADSFGREGLLLSLVGIVVGFIGAQIVAFAVNYANIRFSPPGIAGDIQFVLDPTLWFCALMMLPLILISYLTAYFVAKRQVKKPIVNLLHYGK